MKAETEAALAPVEDTKVEVRDVAAQLGVMGRLAEKAIESNADSIAAGRDAIAGMIVSDFADELGNLAFKLKRALPVYEKEIDWMTTQFSMRATDTGSAPRVNAAVVAAKVAAAKSGTQPTRAAPPPKATPAVQDWILRFHDAIAAGKTKRRIKKYDFTLVKELYPSEKAWLHTLKGIDVDSVFDALPRSAKKSLFDYLLLLFRHARRLKKIHAQVDTGAWTSMVDQISKDMQRDLSQMELSGKVGKRELGAMLMQQFKSRLQQQQPQGQPATAPGAGKVARAELEKIMRMFSVMNPEIGAATNEIAPLLDALDAPAVEPAEKPAK